MARAPRQIKVPGESGASAPPAVSKEASTQERHALASDIPDAADINPKSITRAVLTAQGWVVPE